MRILVALAMGVMACSDAAGGEKDAAPPDATNDAHLDAAVAETGAPSEAAADAAPSQGGCAACTANQCLTELQACGGSQACLNDLVAFNDCLAAQTGDCGSALAAGGAAQAALWSCLSTKCAATCGTN